MKQVLSVKRQSLTVFCAPLVLISFTNQTLHAGVLHIAELGGHNIGSQLNNNMGNCSCCKT